VEPAARSHSTPNHASVSASVAGDAGEGSMADRMDPTVLLTNWHKLLPVPGTEEPPLARGSSSRWRGRGKLVVEPFFTA
jgi:hypothetical protein